MKELPKDMLSTEEFADALGLSPQIIRRWIHSGYIQGHRIGKKKLKIPKSELERILNG